MTDTDDFAESMKTARLAVESLPQHLQGPAFAVILERLLSHGGSAPQSSPPGYPRSLDRSRLLPCLCPYRMSSRRGALGGNRWRGLWSPSPIDRNQLLRTQ